MHIPYSSTFLTSTVGPVMTISMRSDVPIGIATRQMSIASFDLRPASDIEILGIATATCLLAICLFSMLLAVLQKIWHVFSLKLGASDNSHITKTSEKRSETNRSILRWLSIPLGRSRGSYDRQQDNTQTQDLTSSTCKQRMRVSWENHVIMKQYYYTHIPTRCKPTSTEPPLPLSPKMKVTRRKITTLDMEEGLSLKSNAAGIATNLHDNLTRSNLVSFCREPEMKDADDSNRSFLHGRAASL